jgi:cytochrome c oxidase subunit 2
LALAACRGTASALDPASPAAARIAALSWFFFIVAALVCAAVAVAIVVAVWRGRQRAIGPAAGEGSAPPSGGLAAVAIGGIAIPLLILSVTFAYSVWTLRAVTAPPGEPGMTDFPDATAGESAIGPNGANLLTVQVIGEQFWWRIVYPGGGETANELHVPAGRAVRLDLTSKDVIHSFWVPRLMGKLDLIPGKQNRLILRADEAGTYRGGCAEFCGIQHAHMLLHVFADPPAQFDAWLAREQRPARTADDPAVQRGAQVFARAGCITCHQLRVGGGAIGGDAGPDLTHVASRRTLAAGLLDNTIGNLGGWIVNSQALKPGNKMPPIPLDGPDLQALLAYLRSLE